MSDRCNYEVCWSHGVMISLLQVPRGAEGFGFIRRDATRRAVTGAEPIHGRADTRRPIRDAIRPLASTAGRLSWRVADTPPGRPMTAPRGRRAKNCRHTIGHRSSPDRGTRRVRPVAECRDLGFDIEMRIAGRRRASNIRQRRTSWSDGDRQCCRPSFFHCGRTRLQ